MRVAALYDIHGNLPGLDAVLRAADEAGAESIVVGGDVASGPMPAETVDRLIELGDRARFVRGNADRDLVAHFDGAAQDEVEDTSDLWAARSAWAATRLDARHRDFLAGFAATAEVEVDGLGPVLFCHGSPRSDTEIITAATTEERLRDILEGVGHRVVVCGHTHVQFDRIAGGTRVVNAGSVGMPYEGRPGAYWALLGPSVSLMRTTYDFDAAAEAIRESGYPDPEEHIADLFVAPPTRAEATEHFERMATGR